MSFGLCSLLYLVGEELKTLTIVLLPCFDLWFVIP